MLTQSHPQQRRHAWMQLMAALVSSTRAVASLILVCCAQNQSETQRLAGVDTELELMHNL